MSAKLGKNETELFRDLMVLSQLRGWDGSGLTQVTPKRQVHRFRYDGPAGALVRTQQVDAMLNRPTSILIGHARWPTKGGKGIEYLHPHNHGHITGVHNGTLTRVDGKLIGNDESDSGQLFRAISEKGLVEALDDTYGAYALIWVDEKDQSLNFVRNNDRPLWFAEISSPKIDYVHTLAWASERVHLEIALRRFHLSFDDIDFQELPAKTWVKYPLKVGRALKPTLRAMPERKIVHDTRRWNYQTNQYDRVDELPEWEKELNRETRRDRSLVPFRGPQPEKDITPHYIRHTPRLPSDPDGLKKQREHVAALLHPGSTREELEENTEAPFVGDNVVDLFRSEDQEPVAECAVCGCHEPAAECFRAIGVKNTFFCIDCAKDPEYNEYVEPSQRPKVTARMN